MDKVVINNQVVCMRKYVKQAKIRMINKLVKQVKSLEIKNGNEAQISKNKRKIERLLEKIKILKTMKVDYVSKSALSKAKDWKSLIEQKNVSLQDQCLALLANYTSVQMEVEKFYSNHSDMVDKIPSVVIEFEMKCQNPNKKKRKDTNKKKFPVKEKSLFQNNIKVTEREELEIDLIDIAKNKDENSKIETNSSESFDLCDDIEKPTKSIEGNMNCFSLQNSGKGSNQKKVKLSRDQLYNLTKSKKDKNKFSTNNLKTNNELIIDPLKVESNSTGQTSIFEKLSSIANPNFKLPKPNKTNQNEHLVKPTKDPFFITSEDESYDIEKRNSNEVNNNFTKQDNKRSLFNKRTFSQANEKFFSKRKDFGKPPNQWANRPLENRKMRRNANQKRNGTVFNRESSRNSFPNYQNDKKTSPMRNKQVKKSSLPEAKSNQQLHPSWEAKRKLKDCAKTGFTGKRTLFED